jgi:hypothetical protein
MKLIVAGSRGFNNYGLLSDEINNLSEEITEIISGTARGADQLGEKYADYHGIKIVKIPAEWDRLGKSAGYKRNERMAEYADSLIAFWDGESRGTKHMIDIANRLDLPTKVVKY